MGMNSVDSLIDKLEKLKGKYMEHDFFVDIIDGIIFEHEDDDNSCPEYTIDAINEFAELLAKLSQEMKELIE